MASTTALSADQPFTTPPKSEWPSTFFRPVWLYDTEHPDFLYASIVDADKAVTTIVVDCPTSQKSCSGAEFPRQTLTVNREQSVWEGVATASGTTTTWKCDLDAGFDGSFSDGNGGRQPSGEALCAATSGKNLGTAELKPTSWADECWVNERPVVALFTGGVKKLQQYDMYMIQPTESAESVQEILTGDYEAVCGPKKTKSSGGHKTKAQQASEATETSTGTDAAETGSKEAGSEGTEEGDSDSSGKRKPKEGAGAKLSCGMAVSFFLAVSTCILSLA